ncbi:MAG: protein kinase, partial [Chitinivibrionales bacterium]|nr:protein kinase [Chitinivibrionales bacterium]
VEQLEGEKLDERTDIYALGVTLYELLTGAKAFPHRSMTRLLSDKKNNNFLHLNEFDATIPVQLQKLIHQSMHPNPQKRPRSALLFHNRLQRIYAQMTAWTPEQTIHQFITSKSDRFKIQYPKSTLVIHQERFNRKQLTAGVAMGVALMLFSLLMYMTPLKRPIINAFTTFSHHNQHASVPLQEHTDSINNSPSKSASAIELSSQNANLQPAAVPTTKQTRRSGDALSETMVDMVKKKQYKSGLALFNRLNDREKQSPQVLSAAVHALLELDLHKELSSFLSLYSVDDGEFYLGRASIALAGASYERCIFFCDKALQSSSRFSDSTTVQVKATYYKAVCLTILFEREASDTLFHAATATWRDIVDRAGSNAPLSKTYRQKAIKEIHRLEKKFKNN